jgi:hypothetical protein
MVAKLELYNMVLGHLGPSRLTGLNDNRPDRREIDAVWDGVIGGMLERGLWFFALRTQMITPDTDVEPQFGFTYAYRMPDDYRRLRLISIDEAQRLEDPDYRREGAYIFSNQATLYVTFCSDNVNYGFNLGRWTRLFSEATAAEMAFQCGLPIMKDRGTKNDLFVLKKRMLDDALRLDAVDERVKGKPTSSWVNSRFGLGSRGQMRSPRSTGIGSGE